MRLRSWHLSHSVRHPLHPFDAFWLRLALIAAVPFAEYNTKKLKCDVRVECNNWSTRHHYRGEKEWKNWKHFHLLFCFSFSTLGNLISPSSVAGIKSSPTNCHLVFSVKVVILLSRLLCVISSSSSNVVALSPPLRHIKLFCNEKSALKEHSLRWVGRQWCWNGSRLSWFLIAGKLSVFLIVFRKFTKKKIIQCRKFDCQKLPHSFSESSEWLITQNWLPACEIINQLVLFTSTICHIVLCVNVKFVVRLNCCTHSLTLFLSLPSTIQTNYSIFIIFTFNSNNRWALRIN